MVSSCVSRNSLEMVHTVRRSTAGGNTNRHVETVPTIPAVAHFIWFGRSLLWVHLLAIRSAAERGGFSAVVLHHSDDLTSSPWWNELSALPNFEARRLDPTQLLTKCPRGTELLRVYAELESPAAKANVIRAAVLFLEGGTYLDTDTVTLTSFEPLLAPGGVFCGEERINRPYVQRMSRSLKVVIPMFFRRVVRSALREAPRGWKAFRRIEHFYPAAVNNAVLGSEPGHPFIANLIDRMVELPPERRRIRYALGTHLLQQAVAGWSGSGLRIMPPQVFYPLGPEISIHWFRKTRRAHVSEVVTPQTILVHWYASVRTGPIVPAIDQEYVKAQSQTQLFSALAVPFVENRTAAAGQPRQEEVRIAEVA